MFSTCLVTFMHCCYHLNMILNTVSYIIYKNRTCEKTDCLPVMILEAELQMPLPSSFAAG